MQKNLQSKDILLNEEEKKMVCDWILKQMKSEGKKVNMTLLYKLTAHGDGANNFHNYCNNKGYTLSLVRNTKGYRCSGFTTQSWAIRGSYVNDANAIVFSLEMKECYKSYDGTNAIYDNGGNGPVFGAGHDLCIANNCSQNVSNFTNFPYTYGKLGTKPRCLSGGWYSFKVNELEVYKIEIV